MAKLDDYEFKSVPQQVVDFKDDTRDLLNNGKYQSSVATTGIPGWVANTGESAFFSSGSDRRLYLRTATSWQLVAGFNPTLVPSGTGTAAAGTGNTMALIDHVHNVVGTFGATSSQTFTINDTWTRPSVTTRVFVEMWGAGGGGGEGTGSDKGGGGGGGGGHSAGYLAVSGNVSVFIGAGGGESVNGGSSSFLTMSASGGVGGAKAGTGGAGGVAAGGALNLTGQRGQDGLEPISLCGVGGSGGASPRGGAGGQAALARGVTYVGMLPGGGGGGGAADVGGLDDGAAGAAGIVIVYW